ncbi:MAG: head decoration protein [Desulfobacterales bacterium]|nr:head decoration protein [Desulfobacterales bacterium]
MNTQIERTYLNDILKWEQENNYSREEITIQSGENLKIGTVIGKNNAGKVTAIHFSATDGSQNAYGILIDDYDASLGDMAGTAIVRDAMIVSKHLIWPLNITNEQKKAALSQLKTAGIIERKEA